MTKLVGKEKRCEYCNNHMEILSDILCEDEFTIDINFSKQGNFRLNVFGGPEYFSIISYCPMCGKELK